MPSIKETFDKNKYDAMIKDTNYTGALNYLTELSNNTESYEEKDALQPFISNLRQKIHKDESMLRYAVNDSQKEQYYFLDAIRSGSTIEKGRNRYYDSYTKSLSGIGDGYTERSTGTSYGGLVENVKRTPIKATQLEFKFKSKDAFNTFLSNLGTTEKELEQYNVLLGLDNGNRTISINKSNPQFYNIIDNVYKAHVSERDKAVRRVTRLSGFGDLAGTIALQTSKNVDATRGVEYRSRDNKGNIINNYASVVDGKFNGALSNVYGLMKDAKDNYDNLHKQASRDLVVSSFSLPWKTAAHARAEELLTTTGDTDEYKKTVERLDGQLIGGLTALNLSQENVWATGEQDDPNYHQLSPEEKIMYQQILRDAIRDNRIGTADDRLAGVKMAMLGDKFGYQIDILPKSKEGLFSAFGEDNSQIHRTIFIENPWPQEQMTQAFEYRTEFQAMKELILMDQYKYPYEMIDGSILELNNPYGGTLKKADGSFEDVTRQQALQILDENFIKERGIRGLQQKYNTLASKRQYNFDTFEDAIDKDAWGYALQGAKELVSEDNEREYLNKAYDLYNSILNGANYKGKRAVTIKVE